MPSFCFFRVLPRTANAVLLFFAFWTRRRAEGLGGRCGAGYDSTRSSPPPALGCGTEVGYRFFSRA